MTEFAKLNVRFRSDLKVEIVYNTETFETVTATLYDRGVTTVSDTFAETVPELVAKLGVPQDVEDRLTTAMNGEVPGPQRLRYCSNDGCTHPFNFGTANHCDYCGCDLPSADDPSSLSKPIANISLENARTWKSVRKALDLVGAQKLELYTSPSNHAHSLSFGWTGPRPFNKKAHSFRGQSNLRLYEQFCANVPEVRNGTDLNERQNYVTDLDLSDGFLRFAEAYGDKLYGNSGVELNPEGAAALRSSYIFDRWEFGRVTDPSYNSGEPTIPKTMFLMRFFNPGRLGSEYLTEASWDLYQRLLEIAEASAIVKADGNVAWRFDSIEESWDRDFVRGYLRDKYAITEAVLDNLMMRSFEIEE